MKEKDLIKLGFERIDVPIEEAGDEAFYYYVWNNSYDAGLRLISNANNDYSGKNGVWYVEIFDVDGIMFCEKKELKKFIKIVNKNTIK